MFGIFRNMRNPLRLPDSFGNNSGTRRKEGRVRRMAPQRHAAERVRLRIREWLEKTGHGSRTQMAEAVFGKFGAQRSRSWVSDIQKGLDGGGADLRLRDLDAIADLLNVPPGELVRRPADHYVEVTPTELRVLRYFRTMPDVIRGHFLAYVDYIFSFQERALAEQAAERETKTAAARTELKRRKA